MAQAAAAAVVSAAAVATAQHQASRTNLFNAIDHQIVACGIRSLTCACACVFAYSSRGLWSWGLVVVVVLVAWEAATRLPVAGRPAGWSTGRSTGSLGHWLSSRCCHRRTSRMKHPENVARTTRGRDEQRKSYRRHESAILRKKYSRPGCGSSR